MALVEPGPAGVKAEAEVVVAIEAPEEPGAAKRRLGLMFWTSAMWIVGLVFVAVFRDILPIRDPDELGIRTGEVEKFEGLGWNALLGHDDLHRYRARVPRAGLADFRSGHVR